MRWPIQVQLLLPILAVVFLTIALATGAGAYLSYDRARQQQEQQEKNLDRVVSTLFDANFPLTEQVLDKMRELSGAEFLLLDTQGQPRAATLRTTPEELRELAALPLARGVERFSTSAVAAVAGQSYLGRRILVPGRFAAAPPGSLVVLYREDRWSGEARRAVWPALAAGGLASIAAVAITALLARRLVRSIQQLRERTTAIAAGHLEPMAVPARNDEIRDLVVSINRMAQQLSRYERDVRQNERLRTLGQLGAGITHQLRNAATGARIAIELHQLECPSGADPESLEVAMRQLRLMESYLQRFLSLGQDKPRLCEELDLAALVEDAAGLVRPACLHGRIDLEVTRPPEPLVVVGQKDALRELLVNLLLNAVEAAQRGGDPPRVTISVQRALDGMAIISVRDSGPGPSEAVRDRLFEPFVSDKPEGTGVGLFVARRVVESHQGSIAWAREDFMTCFTVTIPLHTPAPVHGAPVGG